MSTWLGGPGPGVSRKEPGRFWIAAAVGEKQDLTRCFCHAMRFARLLAPLLMPGTGLSARSGAVPHIALDISASNNAASAGCRIPQQVIHVASGWRLLRHFTWCRAVSWLIRWDQPAANRDQKLVGAIRRCRTAMALCRSIRGDPARCRMATASPFVSQFGRC